MHLGAIVGTYIHATTGKTARNPELGTAGLSLAEEVEEPEFAHSPPSMPQSLDLLIHTERSHYSSDVSEPEAVPDWFSLLLDSVLETFALGTPAPAGEDLSDAERADGR